MTEPQSAHADVVTLTREGDLALVTLNNPPVNALSTALRAGIVAALAEAAADPAVKGIVMTGAGRGFCAGADITEFGKPPREPFLPDVIAAIEACPKPVVAAIHGPALGGGLEVALGAHARVAAPSAKMGLPEVKLGLIPGAGGTQRLPRLIGPAAAVKLIVSGEPVGDAEALKLGIVTEVAEDVVAAACALARQMIASGVAPVGLSKDEARLEAARAGRDAFEAAAAEVLKGARGAEAPAACVAAVRNSLDLDIEAGMKAERAAFLSLVAGDQSKALRHAFFAEKAAAKIDGLPADAVARPVRSVAVIGAGTMGGGIAMAFANAGYPVTLIETSAEALARGQGNIEKNYASTVARGRMSEAEKGERIARITGSLDLASVANVDLIVEAVFEDMGVKKTLMADLDRLAGPDAILATNTSYLDVNEIASATSRPEAVVGMHFFSPANIMKLLEVVRAAKTAPDVLLAAVEVGRKLGKIPVVVGVCNGFVGNRILRAQRNDLEALLVEGASPAEVDAAWSGFGFPMGPFAMLDLAGLDISWRARKALGQTAEIADHLCEQGRFGQKTGRGFYRYEPGERKPLADSEVEDLAKAIAAREGITRRSIPAAEIVERLLYPMINEGARILEEGIAQRPGDIDVIWIFGYGFPAWRGGPMHAAGSIGLAKIRDGLQARFEQSGRAEFKPAALLERLAAEGGSFAG
ncbi:3-hydroxyacyl-CoA dehydrogenase NAD-binding domain-containing protein [Pannonibacter carbonis]|uniref:3-hydroxyacyl-CoA dehydrogenase NAD-binding domain-containing protein n=1 Tax=Pannonibacter carbonis TaxID=2067569 RepID=UPI000D0ECC52|nr:3-hydroxyacyl-CoA dehydrogenase NAD-binding domain-containing protein [Pannonibacter carbonis]